MAVNGKIANWDQLHVQVQISGLGDGSLQSIWTPDSVDINTWQIECSVLEAGTWTAQITETNVYGPIGGYLNLPFGGLYYTGSGTSVSADLYFNNWKLYATGVDTYLWYVVWDSLDVYVNGTLMNTLAGNNVTSSALGPSWVPIFSGLVEMAGNGPGNGGTAIISGGWEFQTGGTWYSLPTAGMPPTADAPLSGPGHYLRLPPTPTYSTSPFGLNSDGVIITSSTFGAQLSVGLDNANPTTSKSGSVVLIPNLPKTINRMNPDYGATFFSFAVPQTQASSTRSWEYLKVPESTSYNGFSESNTVEVPRSTSAIQEVGNSISGIESQMLIPTWCMGQVTSSENLVITEIDGVVVAGNSEVLNTIYPITMDSLTGSESWSSGAASVAPYMSHADIRANYFNSAACHPHWSMGYWIGPWNLQYGSTNWEDYWGPVREQFMQDQGRRNHIISCPLESSAFTPFLDAFDGGLRWIGVSRWQTQNVNPPTSLTLNASSSGSYTVVASSCTLNWGSNLVVVPTTTGGTAEFAINLATYATSPYLFAGICDRINLDWTDPNIASVQVYAFDSLANTSKLFVTPPVTGSTTPCSYNMVQIQTIDTNYAASWGADNGAGYTGDQGIDVESGGSSATIMGSDITDMNMGFLQGSQPSFLLFYVTLVSGAASGQISYPILYSGQTRQLIGENGQIQDVIYQNGPGVRYTNHVWYDGGLNVPPLISGLGYKASVIDWLCDKRVLLLATSPTSALAAECTQLYDSFEGNSIGQVDLNSISFLLPSASGGLGLEPNWCAALVNTVSEVPPLAGYPSSAYDVAHKWVYYSPQQWTQSVWSWAQVPRRLVSTINQMDIFTPDGITQLSTTSSMLPVSGWIIRDYSPVLTGNEFNNYQIKSGTTLVAKVQPWHGYFGFVQSSNPESHPFHRQSKRGSLHGIKVLGTGDS